MAESRIKEIEEQLALLPAGTLIYKRIKGKEQPYLQWTEKGKTVSKYIKVGERDRILAQIALKKQLQAELKSLKSREFQNSTGSRVAGNPIGTEELSGAVLDRSGTDSGDSESIYSGAGGAMTGQGTIRYDQLDPVLMIKQLQNLGYIADTAAAYKVESPYKMNVIRGLPLEKMIAKVKGWKKRDCFSVLEKFVLGDYPGRVCLLYGLRRTGKTTLLLQILGELEDGLTNAVYMKARTGDRMADLNHDLKLLADQGCKYVFIDEVTLMEDFIDSAALLSDVYGMMGMKIILSGTDSLGFWFTLKQELYDRAVTIHTTYIPFAEYNRVLGIDDIDTYIRYGGTLRMGETDLGDSELLCEDVSFRDDESTRRYIDTAICRNIQHSLTCCKEGTYFRHLRSLYEAGELTGAINRIIESMNHQFLLRILTSRFKSHDLGSAAEILRKQSDPAKRSDILDRIDREAVTAALMRILDIRNEEDRKVGLTKTHVDEIREYLAALDLVWDCPSETAAVNAKPMEYVLFTQPGMRYSQAQALVHVLLQNEEFAAISQHEKNLVCDRILEDVRGRMMEDIVLLETCRKLPRGRKAFKLTLARSEYDMVIYDEKANTCEAYEIKHSSVVDEHQYHVLCDVEACTQTEKIYGKIVRRCVIYRGMERVLDNGIEYMNVEEYLKKL